MVIAILVLMAAAAAGGDDGIVVNGSLVVGSGVVSSIVTWLAAKKHAERREENEKDHENLFIRMSSLEKEHAALSAKVDAKFDAITEQLRETKEMVRQLFDRICKGKKQGEGER